MPGQKLAEEARRAQILDGAYDVAARHGLDGLTIRRVAAAAGLSHGLVHFHFRTKEALLSALLDRLLASTTAMQAATADATGTPRERLAGLLRDELERLTRDRRQIHLFFDFWLLGTRHPRVRSKMRAELDRYRAAFLAPAAAVLGVEPDQFDGVTAETLASVAVAFVKGCAVQSVLDPQGFDIVRVRKAVRALLAEPSTEAVAAAVPPGERRAARSR
jgi:AcrR family transcriptional regulator